MTDPYWEKTKYNYNIKRDALHVASTTSNGSAGAFWGGMLGLAAIFWPLALPAPARIIVMFAWWGLLGVFGIWFLIALTRRTP